ncbi:protein tyrosine phosphatase [Frankia sp. Mgl5]|uniref:arsenate reductase/protein-tyrosine-phosphatase family protein n=1 Tax=Frankia sp. Mgl5 TaxID=2933793 RepID=UPI00200DA8E9|nr:protein tyrosine phosphatase [Frankia sp. Mgl5]MCK9931837.1 protein tyrosine phosphatase [Frankia sp. Mgl5]
MARRSENIGERADWSVLMVCTGNLCRSPMAERLAAARLRRLTAVAGLPGPPEASARVSSAGVRAFPGTPMEPTAAAVLRERGADDIGFCSRQVTPMMVAEADIVLCATRAHRARIVELVPRAVRRTFTLREFARLAEAVAPRYIDALADEVAGCHPSGRLRAAGMALGAAGAGARGVAPPDAPDDDDLGDPLGGGLDDFRACAEVIEAALEPLDRLLAALLGATAPR